jgi:hypothetical protein
MDVAALPFIDEHTTAIAASADRVWDALLVTVDHTFSRRALSAYARVVGGVPAAASGPRPLAEGATVPGFRVAGAVPGAELVLEGRHRFSTYALTFSIEPRGPRSSCLHAKSRAEFPGAGGRVYRALVVGTRGHVLAVRRVLTSVRRRAERSPGS